MLESTPEHLPGYMKLHQRGVEVSSTRIEAMELERRDVAAKLKKYKDLIESIKGSSRTLSKSVQDKYVVARKPAVHRSTSSVATSQYVSVKLPSKPPSATSKSRSYSVTTTATGGGRSVAGSTTPNLAVVGISNGRRKPANKPVPIVLPPLAVSGMPLLRNNILRRPQTSSRSSAASLSRIPRLPTLIPMQKPPPPVADNPVRTMHVSEIACGTNTPVAVPRLYRPAQRVMELSPLAFDEPVTSTVDAVMTKKSNLVIEQFSASSTIPADCTSPPAPESIPISADCTSSNDVDDAVQVPVSAGCTSPHVVDTAVLATMSYTSQGDPLDAISSEQDAISAKIRELIFD